MSASIITSYLGATPEQRRRMQGLMPDLFTAEVVEELAAAEVLMQGVRDEAEEVYGTFDNLVKELELPTDAAAEKAADPAETFATVLGNLLSQYGVDAFGGGGDAAGENGAAEDQRTAKDATEGSLALTQPDSSAPCALLSSELMWVVVSFLQVRDVLRTTEQVCTSWRALTCPAAGNPPSGRLQAFWIGTVQREYAMQLAVLMEAEGEQLLETDWRVLARLVSSEEFAADDDDE